MFRIKVVRFLQIKGVRKVGIILRINRISEIVEVLIQIRKEVVQMFPQVEGSQIRIQHEFQVVNQLKKGELQLRQIAVEGQLLRVLKIARNIS